MKPNLAIVLMALLLIASCSAERNHSEVSPNQNDSVVSQSERQSAGTTQDESTSQSESEHERESGGSTSETRGTTTQSAQDRIRATQDRLRGDNSNVEIQPMRHRMTQMPYAHFNDSDGYTEFRGVSLSEVQRVLGEPPVIVRQSYPGAPVRREVRVYRPYEEDSTGLFLYIRNETVESFRLDTFLGLANSDIFSYFE